MALPRQGSSRVWGAFVCLEQSPCIVCDLYNHFLLPWNPGKSVLRFTSEIFILPASDSPRLSPPGASSVAGCSLGIGASAATLTQPLCKELAGEIVRSQDIGAFTRCPSAVTCASYYDVSRQTAPRAEIARFCASSFEVLPFWGTEERSAACKPKQKPDRVTF